MGRPKREKEVSLTAIRKRVVGRDAKQGVLGELRNLVDQFENIYIFKAENMRNVKLKELRAEWSDSRFYFGRKRIAKVAFGKNKESEYADGLHSLSNRLEGNVGLLFTNRCDSDVRDYFETYCALDVARSGFKATEEVRLDAGPLDMFVPEQEPRLRALGLDVTLVRATVTLRQDFCICAVGQVLTPESAKLLEYLGIEMAEFKINLLCHYSKKRGFSELNAKKCEADHS